MSDADEITGRKLVAVHAMVANPSLGVADIAAAAGVNERTVRRWMQTEAFRSAYRTQVESAFRHETSRLKAMFSRALDVLNTAMEEGPWPTRVRAATSVISAVRDAEITTVMEMLDEMEEQSRGTNP